MTETVLHPRASDDGHAELWLLDVLDEAGPRDLTGITPPPGWTTAQIGVSINGTALVASAGAGDLTLPAEPDTRLRLLRHPWSGGAVLTGAAAQRELRLGATETSVIEVRADGGRAEGTVTEWADGSQRALALDPWLAEVAARRPAAVGIVHPDWRGVRTATEHHLTFVLAPPADLSPEDAEELAARLAEAGVPAVVSGGFPLGQRVLLEALHRRGIRVLVTWHATFLQHGEDINHDSLLAAIAGTRGGIVERIGFTKVGMEAAFTRAGIPATSVMNHLRVAPRVAPPGGERLATAGIWSVGAVWRKLPYAMLAACAELDPVPLVRTSRTDPGLATLADTLGVPLEGFGGPVPRAQVLDALAACDLNLYVTLSECGPMMILESFVAGRPCLIGPNSHYFDDDPFLHDRLVATEPDRHERIAAKMRRAHAEREEILEHVRTAWWPAYRERAHQSVRDFVRAGPGDLI